MRLAAAFLWVLCSAAAFQCLAADPEPAAPSSSEQKTPAPAAPQSAAAPAVEQHAAVPTTPATAAVAGKSDATPPPLTRAEQDLVARGYKPEMRHGQRYFCRREGEIESHFERKVCNTSESILSQRAASEEAVRRMQSNKPQISN
jgi:hypothetical protein